MHKLRWVLVGIIGLVSSLRLTGSFLKHKMDAVAGDGTARKGTTANPKSKQPAPLQWRKWGKTAKIDSAIENSQPVNLPAVPTEHHSDLRDIHSLWGYLKELFHRYNADQCGAWAASLSFYSILSIAPVLLCGLAVLGFLIQDPQQAAQRVQQIITSLLPGDEASATAKEIIAQLKVEQSAAALMQSRGTAGIVGVLSLFWSALQIFVNAMIPMNAAFRAPETRGFVQQRLVGLGLLFGAGLLFLLSLLPASGAQVINSLHIPGVGHLPEPLPPLIRVVFFVVGVAINALMFGLIYRYLPSPAARVHWRNTLRAGAIVAVLWEAAKIGFAFYLGKFGNYNKLYGSLGGLVGLVFWILYTSMILLLGAEITKLIGDAEEGQKLAEQTSSEPSKSQSS